MMGETRGLDTIDAADVVEMARQLIRRPSVNPPGDYAAVAAYVMDVFKEMGLAIRVVEGARGRPNIVGLLQGTGGGAGGGGGGFAFRPTWMWWDPSTPPNGSTLRSRRSWPTACSTGGGRPT